MNHYITRRAFLRLTFIFTAAGLANACQVSPTNITGNDIEILADGLDFPEGPAFDLEGNLWCTEMGTGNLIRLADGKIDRIPTQGRPNSLAFDRDGNAWICDSEQNSIRRFNLTKENWVTVVGEVNGQPLQTPNDLVFDKLGNLLFTCPNFADLAQTGYICCLDTRGNINVIGENFYRPNGLEFINKGEELVVADTLQKKLFKGKWDAIKQKWDSPVEWSYVGGAEGPDGMVFGSNNDLYLAIFGDGLILRLNSEGEIVQRIKLPGRNPTNVTLDPTGKLGLVITEADRGELLSIPKITELPELYNN